MRRGQEFAPLANCHAPGLWSIPVDVRQEQVSRVFIDTLGKVHTIAPHNHRYDLTLTVLRGLLAHTVWEPDNLGALAMWRFEWHSPIQGEPGAFTLKDPNPTRYSLTTDQMRQGEYVKLEAHQFHSLVAEPGTVWMVTEGLDVFRSEALWFAPEYTPDLSGLYVPFPAVAG